MLELDNAGKQYSRRGRTVDALLPTSLTIGQGQFVAVVGPSGSGKTTLLSMLGAMLAPTAGRVLMEGRSVYDLSTRQRARLRGEQVGFVFQHFNLVPWLSALENVQLPLSIYGTDPAVQRGRATELLERFGLADRRDHKPSELSAGQQQRVALARTLINNPALILADEPTGNLDSQSKQCVVECLRECHRAGRTIVMVTHDRSMSVSAGRVLRITAGQVEEERMAEKTAAA